MMPRTMSAAFPIAVAVLLCCPSLASSVDVRGYSGMAEISDNSFLPVNDRKNSIESGYRLDVITFTAADGIVFTPVSVGDWKHEDKEPSDLEACCSIPGREGEFLVAESGSY